MIFFTGGQRPASMVTCCRPQGAPVAVVGILSAFLTVYQSLDNTESYWVLIYRRTRLNNFVKPGIKVPVENG